ncbi:zinc finger CCCH domain-containing protein 5 [Quillaja saponaria]|uniref:Zinc finger CCCH domain-containing protein 5 n=1 Tax=Quillaja saponaria TaxID=32244 RepID=A0AAD7M129_QUISA|nr:zinc finger CCCH domain-containing protein 5 [Quillaja saponaria]
MGEPVTNEGETCTEEKQPEMEVLLGNLSRKEKRKAMKKTKRKHIRKEIAEKEREEEEARLNDPEEQRMIQLMEQEEAERIERERKEFEERERAWIEAMELKKKEEAEEEAEEESRKALEESLKQQHERESELNQDDDWEYVEEGPPEIIWQGNEIIFKKKRVRVPKKASGYDKEEDADRPTSNPLPPQSKAFADYANSSVHSSQQILENVAQQVPNFGTEQDKAHCPFHLKTGVCRFGQHEGLEYTDEEVEHSYEEFYEDVHTEFLKFGEIVNFKVCRNGSFHLKGNVYIEYKLLDSALLAYHSVNGRYFAGKQVTCEFVNVTRWKVAICGEYMKSGFKTCSRGTACNFIHCFRNPGRDYEWADFDKPPPKYWVKKMVALFGYSDEYEQLMEQENAGLMKSSSKNSERYHSRRSRSRERDVLNSGGSGRRNDHENVVRRSKHKQRYSSRDSRSIRSLDEEICKENTREKDNSWRKSRTPDTDGDWLDKDRGRKRHHSPTRESSISRNKDHKSRTRDSDSDGNLSIVYEDRETHHAPSGTSSRQWNRESEYRSYEAGSVGDWSDRERDRERRHSRKRKSSTHQNKGNKSITREAKYDGDLLNRDGESQPEHSSSKESSKHRRRADFQDGYGDCEKRYHEVDGDQSEKDRDRKAHQRHTRKSLKHLRKLEHLDDLGGSCEEWSDKDELKDSHCSKLGKSSIHQNRYFEFSDDNEDSKKKFHNTDTSDDWLDRD